MILCRDNVFKSIKSFFTGRPKIFRIIVLGVSLTLGLYSNVKVYSNARFNGLIGQSPAITQTVTTLGNYREPKLGGYQDPKTLDNYQEPKVLSNYQESKLGSYQEPKLGGYQDPKILENYQNQKLGNYQDSKEKISLVDEYKKILSYVEEAEISNLDNIDDTQSKKR
jgi:hypothetical protein